ncbi:MAG: ABC transporter permease [Lachnospiraceae bacterium]|nr:ABC transporter permease [Lachnospiraceae bacterium]
MFLNILCKKLKICINNKQNIFWTLMFPIILGTLFTIAFGGIFETYKFEEIKTAVVFDTDDAQVIENAKTFLEGISNDGKKLLDIQYMEYDEAEALLKDGEKVNGIIRVKEDGKLTLDIVSNGVLSTIQQSIVTGYNQNVTMIEKVAKEHPENLYEVIKSVSESTSYVLPKSLGGDNKDPFISYFYNLLAMTTLFASMHSLRIGNNTQANMSKVGARANASPVRRMSFQIAGFIASFLVSLAVVEIGLTVMIFVLKVEFGGDILMIYLTSALATLLGVSLGFFVGNLGSFSLDKKEGILVGITLLGCALSGLMYGDMKIIIAEKAPIINKINPTAVISDSYYALNMLGVGSRYFETVMYMVGLSLVLTIGGLLLGRKVSYDSI